MEKTELRQTGIGIIGEVPWGTHFCQFYRTKDDLLDTLVPYFKAGLEGNDFCMWVTAEPLGVRDATEAMRKAVPDFDSYLKKGQIEILPHDRWYLDEGGVFEENRVLNGWVGKLDQALSKGFAGLRLTGNTFWLENKDWDSFSHYEAAVQSVIGKYRIVAICTYSLEKCSHADVIDVMRTHEFALIRKEGKWELVENAAYKYAEEALQRKTQELARSNAELEQFAYIASHDLQEPLRMVSSYVQLLRERYKGKLDQDADDFIGFASDGAARMQTLISDLLRYSRVGTRGKEFQPVNLEGVFNIAIENLKLAIREKAAQITHDPLPQVYGDHGQLIQVFQNLIENGVKFHGEEPPRVHVHAEIKGSECLCSVRDNGIGIPSEASKKLFMLFQRLHGKNEYPGTGIGLAICKRIVERHGGRIWVESKPYGGSTFYFTVPVNST